MILTRLAAVISFEFYGTTRFCETDGRGFGGEVGPEPVPKSEFVFYRIWSGGTSISMRRSYIISLTIVGLAFLWILSGQFGGDEGPQDAASDAAQQEAPQLTQARVARLVAAPVNSKVIVQGETRPNRAVDVKAEIRGTIIEATKDRGAAIKKGEALFVIRDDGRIAQLEKAQADLELRQAEFDAAKSLTQKGINSRIRLTEATSNLKSSEAELQLRQLDVDNLIIKAPFDGVLDARLAEAGDYVEVGKAVAKVVELDPIKVVGQVSESNINDIQVGMPAEIGLVDGRMLEAVLAFRSSSADPETRTFEIELQAPNPDGAVIGGLTATIRLSTGARRGHLVSPSVLTLSDAGEIGVKIVNDESRVRFYPVVILDEGPDGTWIAGLPEEVDLITVGQDFVAENELVERVFVNSDAGSS